jgi:hypothetical protein
MHFYYNLYLWKFPISREQAARLPGAEKENEKRKVMRLPPFTGLLIHDQIGPRVQGVYISRTHKRIIIARCGHCRITVKKLETLDGHICRLSVIRIRLSFNGRTAESIRAMHQPYPLRIGNHLFPVADHDPIELMNYQEPFAGDIIFDHVFFHYPLGLVYFRRTDRANFLHWPGSPPFRIKRKVDIGVP